MTIASEISKLNNNLLDAYSAIGTKGGTVPANKNTDNLTTAINSIPAGTPGTTDSSILIKGYDTTTGVITGSNLGSTGKVYLLDRDTHTYNELPTSSYTSTSITLTTPINRATIQGNTCFYVQPTGEGISNKFMVYGDGTLTVPGWGLVYVQDELTRTISKITCANSTDLNRLQGANNTFGNEVTINGVTIFKSQIVGFQFGDSITSYSIPTLFLAQLENLNQPVVFTNKVTMSTSSTYLMRYNYGFDCPIVFTTQNRVGNYGLMYCRSFNQPLDISMFRYLNATYFMEYCESFNQELKLPTTLTTTSIGNYFLYYARSFNQPLKLPTNLTGIGSYFLENCSAFNSPIDFGNNLTTIGTYFMAYDTSFNQPLTFPSGFTNAGTFFLAYCYVFDSKLTIPGLRTIGTNMLAGTNYNHDTSWLSGVTSIGNNFMFQNNAYNQPIVLSSNLTTIGTNFLAYCQAFNHKLVIPSSVTSIGVSFMQTALSFGHLEVNTTACPNDANTLSHNYSSCRLYEGGVTITGTGRSTWLANLPNSTTNPYRKLIDGGA